MNRLQAVQEKRPVVSEQDRILINAGHRITLPRSLTESTHEYVAITLEGKKHGKMFKISFLSEIFFVNRQMDMELSTERKKSALEYSFGVDCK